MSSDNKTLITQLVTKTNANIQWLSFGTDSKISGKTETNGNKRVRYLLPKPTGSYAKTMATIGSKSDSIEPKCRPKICSEVKDSFERFGDHLSEVLLSYLSIEDKFRFECICKQWQELVFKRQTILTIDDKLLNNEDKNDFFANFKVNVNKLETILKKCPNISFIDIFDHLIHNKTEVFQLIVRYCHRLEAINCDFYGLLAMGEFIRKFSPTLKRIRFYGIKEQNKEMVTHFANLEVLNITLFSFYGNNLNSIVFRNKKYFQNLKSITFEYWDKDSKSLVKLFEIYKNSLQSIDINISHNVNKNGLKVLFNSMPNLTQLKTLYIASGNTRIDYSFADLLTRLSINCQQLARIWLNLDNIDNGLQLKIWKAMNGFKQLKAIQLFLESDEKLKNNVFAITSKDLKDCKNLLQLRVNSTAFRFTDQFFSSIDSHWPKLQIFIGMNSSNDKSITEETFHSLAMLSQLRMICFFEKIANIDKPFVRNVFKNSRKLETVWIGNENLFTN